MTTPFPPEPEQTKKKDGGGRAAGWALGGVAVGCLIPVIGVVILLAGIGSAIGSAFGDLGTTGTPSLALGDAVAVVRVEGTITHGDQATTLTGGAVSGLVNADLERAIADENVKAIVLRIDSPGGGVTGSAQIREAVLTADKPVVASMNGTAASGGYYVAAPADEIFARPDTVTGSIGVITTVMNAEELLEKIGVEMTALTSGPNKAMGSMWEPMDAEEEAIMQALIDEYYDEFVRVVAEGRGMDEARVRQLADGRIYTGLQALDLGLVDTLGDLDDAIARAAQLGGIEGEPYVVEYPRTPDFLGLLGGLQARLGRSQAEEAQQVIDSFLNGRIEYRYTGPQG